MVQALFRSSSGLPFRWIIHHLYYTCDNIIYIGEVPLHLAVIKDIYGPTFEYRLCKDKKGHIRPSPGAIYSKKPQACGGDTV